MEIKILFEWHEGVRGRDAVTRLSAPYAGEAGNP